MNEKYSNVGREIVTKERLYERLNDAIRESQILIVKAETRLDALISFKRNLNEYFEDLNKVESEGKK